MDLLTIGLGIIGVIGSLASLFPIPYRQSVQIVAAVCLVFVVFQLGQQHERREWELKVAQLNEQIAKLETESQKVTTQVVTEYVDRVKIVKEKADAIIVKVPVYVNKSADANCTINNGFVVLHDAAAKNKVPETPRDSHAEASGVKLSTIASTVAGNYGTCHEIRQQLESLQQWVREQEKLINRD